MKIWSVSVEVDDSARPRRARGGQFQAGFTLLELVIVMAIIGLMAVYAIPTYQDATRRAKEAILRQDLVRMREALDEYLTDKGVYPPTLDDLVEGGYLRAIPIDPITSANDTWVEGITPWMLVEQGQSVGIWNVHSGAEGEGLDGIAYAEW